MGALGAALAALDVPLATAYDAPRIKNAQMRVKHDFYTKAIDYVAEKTGHETLANGVFFSLTFDGQYSVYAEMYWDSSVIEGIFESHSCYHPGSGGWDIVPHTHNVNKDTYWFMKEAGLIPKGTYGGIEADRLMSNFWDEGFDATNGWPRGEADVLVVYKKHENPDGFTASQNFINKYSAGNYYYKYLLEELGA